MQTTGAGKMTTREMLEQFASMGALSFIITTTLLGVMGVMGILNIISTDSYKDGQIDAINGNIKYHLVTQPDSTVAWEEK